MSNKRKPLKTPRLIAFRKQQGQCFYCKSPMWLDRAEHFATKHAITTAQAKQCQCTGEHLRAKADGGTDKKENIVAACWFCNNKRHRKKIPLTPENFQRYVQRRIKLGRWNQFISGSLQARSLD